MCAYEDELRMARTAEILVENSDKRDFWKEVKRMEGKSKQIPPHVDGRTEAETINNVFTQKYEMLYNSVQSDESEIRGIHDKIKDDLSSYSGENQIITVKEIQKAKEKLKRDKSDGGLGLWSNHIVLYSPDVVNVHLSLLATMMMVHGFNAESLLVGTIVSLPKDTRGNICDSNNYRGICLCSAINKLIELCMINRHSEELSTHGLQFSFKSEHSTTMCSLSLKEVVTYYWNRKSPVYSCFMDASKAFDRIRYDKLFDILQKRGIDPLMLRLLMDMYHRQKSRTCWDNIYGDYFESINGVRQGGVASPLMFTVYIDELIKILEKSGIGCHIGHKFYGCIIYADDFTLLSPSLKGLQKMVDICSDFGQEYSVSYNASKTKCMKFERVPSGSMPSTPILLNNSALQWETSMKHLGNILQNNLSECEEIRYKRGDFIGRINGILIRYKNATPQVLMNLVSSFCTHLYGCQGWNLTDNHVESMVTAWNKGMRKVWKLPPHSHTVLLCALNDGVHIYDCIFKRFLKMLKCMSNSSNDHILFLTEVAKQDKRSIISRNMKFICIKTKQLDVTSSATDICVYKKDDIEANLHTTEMIKELHHEINGFNQDEIQDILDCISTL